MGALATVVTVAPLFLGTDPFPAPAYFVCMLMGVGFLLAAAGLVRSARGQRPPRESGGSRKPRASQPDAGRREQ